MRQPPPPLHDTLLLLRRLTFSPRGEAGERAHDERGKKPGAGRMADGGGGTLWTVFHISSAQQRCRSIPVHPEEGWRGGGGEPYPSTRAPREHRRPDLDSPAPTSTRVTNRVRRDPGPLRKGSSDGSKPSEGASRGIGLVSPVVAAAHIGNNNNNNGNDPSAGSPTETLLRLLLPLNAQVCRSFRHRSGRKAGAKQSKRLTKTFNR